MRTYYAGTPCIIFCIILKDNDNALSLSFFSNANTLMIIYSNWLWANFNLEKVISWCLKINGWFFRQKTTWLLKIAIYLMTLIRETKKISLFWKKNIEMHHCHHCCNYGTFLHHLVHPGLSSHGQDEELGILNMSCCTMHSGKILIKKCNFRCKYH